MRGYYDSDASMAMRCQYEASAQKINGTNKELESKVVAQIELYRKKLGMKATDYAALLGVTKEVYYKLVSQNRQLDIYTFFTFCRLFRFDLASVAGDAWASEQDATLRELSIFLGQLSPATLQKMADTLAASSEPQQTKERGAVLINGLFELVQRDDYEPFVLFANEDGSYCDDDAPASP